jgi:hypothetical protein
VRIVQILDEFQYLNEWIVADENPELKEKLCYSYMGTAESKFSPQIIAGSYIGWLGAILRQMTGRYDDWQLEGLGDEEALEAVYNYATVYQVPITEETAPYIAEVCGNDPWYIASTIRNRISEKDLTNREGVRDALTLETTAGKGAVAKMWGEYLLAAFPRVEEIEDEFKKELATARREAARHKGSAAEYKVRYRLFMASLRGATLADIVTEGAPEGIALGPFASDDTAA